LKEKPFSKTYPPCVWVRAALKVLDFHPSRIHTKPYNQTLKPLQRNLRVKAMISMD